MPYTTIAVYPETKRIMAKYCKANPDIKSYDAMINHLLNSPRNTGRVAESAQKASDIFDLFIKEFPSFWGSFETRFFETVPRDRLKKYLETAGRRPPKSKRDATIGYAKLKGPILEDFQVSTKRSPKGKTIVRKGSGGRRRSRRSTARGSR